MKSILKMLAGSLFILFHSACNGKISHSKTVTLKINGNCEMCKETIENAANKKNVVDLVWNQDTKVATMTYDTTTTNIDEVLKRVAYAGYDNERFLAPDDAYNKLPGCCQYERTGKGKPVVVEKTSTDTLVNKKSDSAVATVAASQVQLVYNAYIELKNALVNTNNASASSKATALKSTIDALDMSKLSTAEHAVWMKVYKNLSSVAGKMSTSKDIESQRMDFMSLSTDMYELVKASNLGQVVYYQYCPMYNDGKGAKWLSNENGVKNPYYGSQMLTCGKTVEVIKSEK